MADRNTKEFHGLRVIGGRSGSKRIGKVLRAVFSPGDYRYQGLIISRPDLLFMFKRSDRFLAHDAQSLVDGRLRAAKAADSWDGLACKRLNIDWDECLILEGLPVVTAKGEKLGTIDSVDFDKHTRKATLLKVTEGATAKAIVGSADIPVELIAGVKDGALVAKAPAAKIQAEGGLAAKAGEQTAILTHNIKEKTKGVRDAVEKNAGELGKKATQQAGKAVDTGAKALGKQLGKTKGMFKAFKDEYKKESGRK